MNLPYENATSGKNAVSEMQKILQNFGCQSFGCMEDFEKNQVIVYFKHRDVPVQITASISGYAALWIKKYPYSARTRGSRVEHEKRAMKQAQLSVYSILRDWIKGQVTAVEVGMLSFEGAFLGQIMLPSGQNVLEAINDKKLLQICDSSQHA